MEKRGSSIVDLADASCATGFQFVEIVRQICWIEFAFDLAVATKQAAVRDVVPFRDQMRGDEHCLAALASKRSVSCSRLRQAGSRLRPGSSSSSTGASGKSNNARPSR